MRLTKEQFMFGNNLIFDESLKEFIKSYGPRSVSTDTIAAARRYLREQYTQET